MLTQVERSIRKAIPLTAPKPVIAIKFINKNHAFRQGRLKPTDLNKEKSLHEHLKRHQNIIRFFVSGQDESWIWIAMELAEGGDLFDKIEADAGVGEDVAHFYFTQLISAVGYMHSMGVAHRDIKPENILLSGEGDLKLADFGMAALFLKDGTKRLCRGICGSPPYIAPEIVTGNPRRAGAGYEPNVSDLWSCGVVLFVLLVGNTPWDEPTLSSPEFAEYAANQGRAADDDDLWAGIPPAALSLLRGILKLDPAERFGLPEIRRHPWFTRPNALLSSEGTAANPVGLATRMLEALRIDFDADPTPTPRERQRSMMMQQQQRTSVRPSNGSSAVVDEDAMDIDTEGTGIAQRLAATQPETPLADRPFDWEVGPRLGSASHTLLADNTISSSQPVTTTLSSSSSTHPSSTSSSSSRFRPPSSSSSSSYYHRPQPAPRHPSSQLLDTLSEDPSLSQFTATPTVPLTLTQMARRFHDIVPAHSLTRFLSAYAPSLLLPLLSDALHRLGVPIPPFAEAVGGRRACVRFKAMDGRGQSMSGTIDVEVVSGSADGDGGVVVREVRFVKAKGDPVEWRRLFKRVCVLCREAILVPA